MRQWTARHRLAASGNGGVGGNDSSSPLLSILPGGATTAQIANPAGLTDARGNTVSCVRSTANYARKSLTFDTAQLFQNSEAIGATGWTAANSGASNPVITQNADVAPDGTNSASTISFPSVSGAGNFSIFFQSFTGTAAAYTFSIYLRVASGTGTVNIMMTPNGVSQTITTCSLTTSWQRFSVTSTLSASTWYLQTGTDLRDSNQVPSSAVTISAWGAKLEQASSATAYVSPMLVSIPANKARVEPEGLLVEGSSTNLLLWSNDFTNAAWTNNGATVTASFGIAPDGTSTAQRIQIPTPGSNISQGRAVTGTVATASFWLRATTGSVSNVVVKLLNGSSGFSVLATATPTLTTSWQRVSVTASGTFSSGNTLIPVLDVASSSADIEAWGSDLEARPSASSYVPTTTVAVTRPADQCSMSMAIALGPTPGFSMTVTTSDLSVAPGFLFVYNGPVDRWGLLALAAGNLDVDYNNSVEFNSVSSNGAIVAGVTTQIAGKYDGTSLWNKVGSTWTPVARSFVATPVQANVAIGDASIAGGGFLNGWISNIAVYRNGSSLN